MKNYTLFDLSSLLGSIDLHSYNLSPYKRFLKFGLTFAIFDILKVQVSLQHKYIVNMLMSNCLVKENYISLKKKQKPPQLI